MFAVAGGCGAHLMSLLMDDRWLRISESIWCMPIIQSEQSMSMMSVVVAIIQIICPPCWPDE